MTAVDQPVESACYSRNSRHSHAIFIKLFHVLNSTTASAIPHKALHSACNRWDTDVHPSLSTFRQRLYPASFPDIIADNS